MPRLFPALLARLAALVALPTVLVVGILALAGVQSAGILALAGAAMAVLGGVLAAFWGDAIKLMWWVNGLAGGAEPPPPPLVTELARRTVGDLRRYRRGVARKVERLAAQSERTAAILDQLPDPILLLDRRRRVVRANPAATAILGELPVGRDLTETLRRPEVLEAVDAVMAGRGPQVAEYSEPVPVERIFQVHVLPFDRAAGDRPPAAGPEADGEEGELDETPATLISLHDITAMKRSERMHADFVANASHELRTPLSSLVGFIETLRGPAQGDLEAQERFLAIMEDQAGRMARLINDLLSLSRIELEEHTPPTARVEIGGLLKGVVDSLRLRAEARNIAVSLDVPPNPPHNRLMVLGDPDQLTQVFQNLVDNALKYGRAGTPVLVQVTAPSGDGGMVVISVADQGEGIPKEHIPRLTERFYRVDAARSRAVGGTGLGLAIVKHIVARHRGRLTIESQPGKGSRFSVHLPVARARARRPAQTASAAAE